MMCARMRYAERQDFIVAELWQALYGHDSADGRYLRPAHVKWRGAPPSAWREVEFLWSGCQPPSEIVRNHLICANASVCSRCMLALAQNTFTHFDRRAETVDEYYSESDLPVMLTIMDVAKLLRVSKNTAYSFVKSGKFPYVKVGHQIRVFRDDVMRYIQAPSEI